jgi:hypothetical protein
MYFSVLLFVLPSITMLYFISWKPIFMQTHQGAMYLPKLNICTSRSYWYVLSSIIMLYFLSWQSFFIQIYEGPCTSLNWISVLLLLIGMYFPSSQCCTSRYDRHFSQIYEGPCTSLKWIFVLLLLTGLYFPSSQCCISRSRYDRQFV